MDKHWKYFLLVMAIVTLVALAPMLLLPQLMNATGEITVKVVWIGFVFAIGALIFILLIMRRFEREHNYSDRSMRYTTDKLNTLAKGKFHDIRNNYSKISYLIKKGELEKVRKYVDSSAYYFSLLLNNWERNDWTIKDEWELLMAYYEAQKTLGIDVEITPDFGGIDIAHVLFIPEVFTGILQNSISHAFREDLITSGFNKKHMFRVSAEIKTDQYKQQYLSFQIWDNGIPSNSADYIQEDKPNKGLSLLQKRISNSYKLMKVKQEHFFFEKLKVETGVGTTIKFVYPYATTS